MGEPELEIFLKELALDSSQRSLKTGGEVCSIDVGPMMRRFTRPIDILWVPSQLGRKELRIDPGEYLKRAVEEAEPSTRNVLLIFGLSPSDLQETRQLPRNWIPISLQERRHLLLSSKPREALRALLRERVPLPELSPYQTKYYVPERMFFGREEHLNDILRSGDPTVAILGPRRIGKTSLAKAVERALRTAKRNRIHIRKDRYAETVAYVDCNLLATIDTDPEEEFFVEMLTSMGLEARDIFSIRKIVRGKVTEGTAFDLIKYLSQQKYPGLTLIIDEVDGLLDRQKAMRWKLLRSIQGLMDRGQAGSLAGERTGVIIAGFTELNRCISDQSFPFFGRAKRIVLSNLGHEAVAKLVTEPMRELGIQIANSQDVINRISFHTGGMPSVVQSLCAEMLERLSTLALPYRIVTPELVEEVVAGQALLGEYIRWFDHHASDLEKFVVYVSAVHGRFVSSSFYRECKALRLPLPSKVDVHQALEQLTFANILKEVKPQEVYEFSVEAFRQSSVDRLAKEHDRTVFLKRMGKRCLQ